MSHKSNADNLQDGSASIFLLLLIVQKIRNGLNMSGLSLLFFLFKAQPNKKEAQRAHSVFFFLSFRCITAALVLMIAKKLLLCLRENS